MAAIDRRLTRLWERMAAMYGSRWELEYGPIATANGAVAPLAAIWLESIAEVPSDAIATGLRKCMDRDSDRPPTLPEFLRLCGRRAAAAMPCHKALSCDSHRPPPSDTPAQRCAQMAEFLAEVAQEELTPRLRPLLPDDRKAAVRAYWLSQIAASGGFGKTIAKAIQPQQEAA